MPRMVAGVLLLVVLAGCAGAPDGATGQSLAPEPAVSDQEVQERIRFIEERLDSHRLHAQTWYWGWMTVFVASAGYNSYGAATTDHGPNRVNGISQALLSASGIGDLLFRPLNARFGADPIRGLPDATPEQRRQKLERAEALLEDNAERAETRTSWLHHLANAAANGLAGAAVWAAGDGRQGAISALTGTLGGELQIWTEPGGPVQDLEDYERFTSGRAARVDGGWQVVPALDGVAVRYRF
jgi:hypothetical protein